MDSGVMYTSINLNDDSDRRQATSASSAAEAGVAGGSGGGRARHLAGDSDTSPQLRRVDEADEAVATADAADAEGQPEFRDEFNLVYISMVLAGIGFLLPYNSFVNAVDFYQRRFDSHLIIFDISMTYITVMLLSVFLTNLLVTRIHLRWRITFGYMVAIVVLFVTTLFDIILNVFPPSWSYGITLLSAGIVSLGCTVQQSSFYGYTSLLPRRFTQAVMLGESCAGFIVSMNRLLTKSMVTSVAPSTALFFILSSCMLLLCLLTFTLGVKSQYVRQFIQPTSTRHLPEDRVRMLPSGLDNPAYHAEMQDLNFLDDVNQQPNLVTTPDGDGSGSQGENSPITEAPDHRPPAAAQPVTIAQQLRPIADAQQDMEAGLQLRLGVAHSIWLYMSSIALCYLVTLSLFPGIESEIPSCRLQDWMPIVLMAVFNGSDLVGKLLAAIPVGWRGGPLLMCSLFRFCLIPLFMSSASPRQKPHIRSETWAYFITAVLGLSNGYFGSVPMINAPKTVQSSRREIAGNLMTLSYSVGLTAGSGISYWLDDLLGPMPAKLKTWEFACGLYNVSHVIGR